MHESLVSCETCEEIRVVRRNPKACHAVEHLGVLHDRKQVTFLSIRGRQIAEGGTGLKTVFAVIFNACDKT